MESARSVSRNSERGRCARSARPTRGKTVRLPQRGIAPLPMNRDLGYRLNDNPTDLKCFKE